MNKIMRNKRTQAGILLAVVLLFCGFFTVIKNAEAADMGVTISAVCGYDGYGKFGRRIPFQAEVEAYEGFVGVVRVVVPTDDGNHNYAYEYPIQVDESERAVVKSEIPLISNYTSFYTEVLDEKNRVLSSGQVSVMTSGSEVTELYVGVLSVNEDAVGAFNGVNVGEYTDSSFPYVKTRAFALAGEDIESGCYGIDSLDIIVMDETMVDALTSQQKAVLKQWVSEGGVLIAEISRRGYIFPKNLYSVTEAVEARPYLWVQTQQIKNGIVGYFDLKVSDMDLMEFAVDNSAISGSVISKACSADRINSIIESDHYYDGQTGYDAVSNLLNTAMGRKLPRISVYLFVIFLYLLTAGPVLYYVLRKKDMAGRTGTGVTVLAIGFSVIIYLMGTPTRFGSVFVRYASIWTVEGSGVTEETYIDSIAPTSNSYRLHINKDYQVEPVSVGNHYYYEDVISGRTIKDFHTELFYGGEETVVTMRQAAPFSSQYFQLEKEREEKDLFGLKADVFYFNEVVSGKVFNGTQRTLEDVVLLTGGQAFVMGRLLPGESADIENARIVYYYPNAYETAAENITGMKGISYQMDGENKEYARLSQKTSLLNYYLSQYSTGRDSEAVLLAFLPADTAPEFLSGSQYPVYGVTMIQEAVPLNSSYRGVTYQNLTASDIINIDDEMGYNAITDSTYSTSIRLQYELGSREGLKKIRFASRVVDESTQYYKAFTGEARFYNPTTLEYELVDLSQVDFRIEQIEKYLSEKNGSYSLIVQYTSDPMDVSQYTEIQLPLVSVIREE